MGAERILVVDDERPLLEVLQAYLEREGFRVATAASAREALGLLPSFRPDLVILDRMLPDLPGEEVCRRIRREGDVPIVMLTAKSTTEDIVQGLDLGADDYVVKPFSPQELAARVRAILRRARGEPLAPAERMSFSGGALVIDPAQRLVWVGGRPVALTRTEWDLLGLLARHPRRVWTRAQLVTLLRGGDFEGDERLVDAYVRRLRAKLGDDPRNPRFIITVWGTGYRFGGVPDDEP